MVNGKRRGHVYYSSDQFSPLDFGMSFPEAQEFLAAHLVRRCSGVGHFLRRWPCVDLRCPIVIGVRARCNPAQRRNDGVSFMAVQSRDQRNGPRHKAVAFWDATALCRGGSRSFLIVKTNLATHGTTPWHSPVHRITRGSIGCGSSGAPSGRGGAFGSASTRTLVEYSLPSTSITMR